MTAIRSHQRYGFTLIELLIVVAIIAILAAIAVPNFLEAQVRSKVSRAKTDMRTIGVGLEAYKVDNTHYPPDMVEWYLVLGNDYLERLNLLFVLTTPVAYVTSTPRNIFVNKKSTDVRKELYDYSAEGSRKWHLGEYAGLNTPWGPAPTEPAAKIVLYGDSRGYWNLVTFGPDLLYNQGQWYLFGEDVVNHTDAFSNDGPGCLYDPTNGTISAGDICRRGP